MLFGGTENAGPENPRLEIGRIEFAGIENAVCLG